MHEALLACQVHSPHLFQPKPSGAKCAPTAAAELGQARPFPIHAGVSEKGAVVADIVSYFAASHNMRTERLQTQHRIPIFLQTTMLFGNVFQ